MSLPGGGVFSRPLSSTGSPAVIRLPKKPYPYEKIVKIHTSVGRQKQLNNIV